MAEFSRTMQADFKKISSEVIQAELSICDRYHDIRLLLFIGLPDYEITRVEASFHRTPSPYCPLIETKLKQLVGVRVARGLNRTLNQLFSGSEGCINMKNLLAAFLPLVINTHLVSGASSEEEALETVARELAGTCVGYPPRPSD
ncbi:Protein of unknown function [Carboxydocella sporoproducens DSM 16521]|uniref:DUF2889 domain-containing protein n=2 Tax=Carboxydocella TaxID=178898 RepID=A0A1T4NHW2_9FIRM|nr:MULTISPECIES: DUF2889 domain-containing protein [Carboxydocella]AVX20033.1 Protein of unknown function (DUF2889) [Carboxydocella thermautotrophica]AVX30450.1 Protein of unknown function (DUF2889) [Carboxydocella thermautotrophica]GAW30182.1 hypothetical protein ULO1_27520 [Carboxydocella sp. ULO1]SJZ78358.1 Protein of unknown function [Carboxydocella sporoproducens DSM 16521]